MTSRILWRNKASLRSLLAFRVAASVNLSVRRSYGSCGHLAVSRRLGYGHLRCAPNRIWSRSLCSETESAEELSGCGIVVGCYDNDSGYELTEGGRNIDQQTQGRLGQMIDVSGGKVKKGDARLFYDLTEDHSHVVVVGMGQREPSEDHLEDIDVKRQGVRSAAAVGAKVLQKARVKEALLDDFGDPEACAEGSTLALFSCDQLKAEKKRKKVPELRLLSEDRGKLEGWSRGCVVAGAQNFARELMDAPSNLMTPTLFVEAVSSRLGQVKEGATAGGRGRLEVIPRPASWIESQKMGAFLSVTKGSAEKPWLLEIHYNCENTQGGEHNPIVLVGKGVTFDTGGISIKPAAGMQNMKADMGGAACVATTTLAIAQLGLPVSVVGLMPLCENMPSGTATKPGDIVRAMNGKTIEVDNTDAEGRLLLADTLCYAHSFNPRTIVNLATLTGAVDVALGTGAAAVFTNSHSLWKQLHKAGQTTGDRLWRMPLYEQYSKQIESRMADVNNVGSRGRSAGACTAAAFLKEFVEMQNWAHIDIAGVMESVGELPFLDKGMAGRPTRTLITFLESCQEK